MHLTPNDKFPTHLCVCKKQLAGYDTKAKDTTHYNILCQYTRVVPKVMSNFFFLHANWEQQTKESAVVDGTSCCVILECLVTSIACIT